MRFRDRRDAGRRLAEELARLDLPDPVVLALPRGGLPVAAEIAARLKAPLGLALVRKIGVPGWSELAAGAVVDGAEPFTVWNEDVLQSFGLRREDLEPARAAALAEIARRRAAYGISEAGPEIKGRSAILVDDGVATGATVRAGLAALRGAGPASITLAVPVAAPTTLVELKAEADHVVCLSAPRGFAAVGEAYEAFPQLTDDDVVRILATQD